jgi:hypothetical protein
VTVDTDGSTDAVRAQLAAANQAADRAGADAESIGDLPHREKFRLRREADANASLGILIPVLVVFLRPIVGPQALGRGARLSDKATDRAWVQRGFSAHELDGHALSELKVPGGDDDSHSTGTEDAFHLVLPHNHVARGWNSSRRPGHFCGHGMCLRLRGHKMPQPSRSVGTRPDRR